jgi:cysteine-rich repeat protein
MSNGRSLALLLVLVLVAIPACGDDDGGTNQNNNVTPPVCGNGTVELGELCDEGVANSDTEPDACRTTCRPAYCGDGTVDASEVCDDGNVEVGDGCSAACTVETGWDCTGSACAPICQDGLAVGEETCDGSDLREEDPQQQG